MTIRPFVVPFSQPALEDLRDRLERSRWPDPSPALGWEQGVDLDLFSRLAAIGKTSSIGSCRWKDYQRSIIIVTGSMTGSTLSTNAAKVPFRFIPGSYKPYLAKQPEVSGDEQAFLVKLESWSEESGAYAHIQRRRPQTLAYGLNDSPAGLAAWILEKFREWSDCGGDLYRRLGRMSY